MAQQLINVGTAPNIGNGEPVRDGFEKAISNVEELLESQDIQVDTFDLPDIGISPNDHTGDLITIGFEKLQFQQEILNDYQDYDKRITTDLGVVDDNQFTLDYLKFLKQQGTLENTKLLIAPEMGTKRRVSGVNTYVSKAYSAQLPTNDAVQSTELSQPWLSGNIAPNERLALKNPNGGTRLMTHPAISFAANEAWSVSTCFNWNGSLITEPIDLFGNISGIGRFEINRGADQHMFKFTNSLGIAVNPIFNNSFIIGKNTVLTLIADGANLAVYVNANLAWSAIVTTSLTINALLQGFSSSGRNFRGKVHAYRIQSGAMTPEQVTAEYNFLRARFPEMESVVIGSQEWTTSNFEAVATPQGNVIQEMQPNAAVVKLNDTFDSSTGWILPTGTSISGGKLVFTNAAWVTAYKTGVTVLGKWYKCTLTIDSITSGALALTITGSSINISSAGTYTFYLKNTTSGGTLVGITSASASTNAVVDNFIVEELGWANSTEIYDAVYAATSGTDEQKTYAAVKEAAMWCHYNNSVDNGAIYGKLYNWYAAKLLQMDIDYYNAANPATPWGWRASLDADWDNLEPNENDNSFKLSGNSYWFAGNEGTNSNGFTALPAGFRYFDGTFYDLTKTAAFWNVDNDYNKTLGLSLRLLHT